MRPFDGVPHLIFAVLFISFFSLCLSLGIFSWPVSKSMNYVFLWSRLFLKSSDKVLISDIYFLENPLGLKKKIWFKITSFHPFFFFNHCICFKSLTSNFNIWVISSLPNCLVFSWLSVTLICLFGCFLYVYCVPNIVCKRKLFSFRLSYFIPERFALFCVRLGKMLTISFWSGIK